MNVDKQLIKELYEIGIQQKEELSVEKLNELYEKKKNVKLKNVELVNALNFLEYHRMCCLRNENNNIYARMRKEEIIKKLSKLSIVDYTIFTKVEASQNNGIWTADIRKQSKLLIHQVQKGVKLLCEQKLIKQVNNIHVKNRKMYILYELEASDKVIGGSFYTDGEFNKKIFNFMKDQICFFLKNHNNSPVSSVIKYIKQLDNKIACFTDNDIYKIIETLSYEEKVKIYKTNTGEEFIYYYYYYYNDINTTDFQTTIPCFSCELFNKCNSDANAAINPNNCLYLNAYLNLIKVKDCEEDTNVKVEQN